MPTLVLKPFTETVITLAQEQAIKDFLAGEDEFMTVNKLTFSRSTFAYIKPGGYSSVDLPPANDPGRRLKADNRSTEEQELAASKKSTEIREIIRKKGVRGLKKKTAKAKL